MLDGVNDDPEQAAVLAELLKPREAFKVNLIPYNPTPGRYTRLDRGDDRGLPPVLRAQRHPDHGPPHPRPRHRRGLRPAGRPAA